MSSDPIIEPSSLDTLPAFRLLDVRDPSAFSSGHAANAIRVPIEIWEAAAKAGETSFENVAYWDRAINDLGIGADMPAVIYDDGRLTEAARVWFILQYFGAKAFILNGGWPVLEGRFEVQGTARGTNTTAAFRAQPGLGLVGLVDRLTLKAELDGDLRIFDARTAREYTGEDMRSNARGGHLPGARLLPHANLLDGSRLKPAAELRNILAEAGFRPGDHIVTHCDGGGRAALAAAAVARAGYSGVRAYYLSFSDWAKDESCSIVGD